MKAPLNFLSIKTYCPTTYEEFNTESQITKH